MKTKAVLDVKHGDPLVIDEVEIPEPNPEQVIVKLLATGICHSQLHQIAVPTRPRPLTLGHEATGIVSSVGANVTHVQEGQKVIATWVSRKPIQGFPGGITGNDHMGITHKGVQVWGKTCMWSEDTIVGGDYVEPIADDAPPDLTCIIGCAVLTGAGAVRYTAGVGEGDSVAVFGVGGVGLSAIWMASILKAYPIIAVDLMDDKLNLAREFGATHVVNASDVDPVSAIKDLHSGGVEYAFDAIGVDVTTEQILRVTKEGGPGAYNRGGTSVLVGVPTQKMTFEASHFAAFHKSYIGSAGASYPIKDFEMFMRYYKEGKFPLEKLVTRRYKLHEVNDAVSALHAGEILGRAVIEL